jgi:hypothetical protein
VLAEAAAICLETNGHPQGVTLSVRGAISGGFKLNWQPVAERARRAYNSDDAVEHGACAVAILLLREIAGFVAVQRSVTRTAIDYWLGDATDLPFQYKARLEVSGIMRGAEKDIKARVRMKRKQTEQSDGTQLSAWIVVVEFGRPVAEVAKR